MYKLSLFLVVVFCSLYALGAPVAQTVLSGAATQKVFCALTTDCEEIDLDIAIPERIPDIRAYIKGFKQHCVLSASLKNQFCHVDIVTEGTCQVSLGWYGGVDEFKGNTALKGSMIANMAKAHLGVRTPRRFCAGGVESVSSPFGTLVVGVKGLGHPLL